MSRRQSEQKVKRRYIPSLDGLRGLAVFAVIAYHLGIPFASGGLLGVTVFFVLSGYLITGLLTAEFEESNTINLIQFWIRRIRRLFPAIVLVVVVVVFLCVLFNHPLLTKIRPDILPSLFWFQNWWYVFRGLSYFDSLGDPSPLTHFWSLAIEEQFYVIWPLILIVVFKLGASHKVIRRGCLVLSAISVLAMALLFDPFADPTRVYYGTDTRAFSLLIGAWLSFFWPGQALTEEGTAHVPRGIINTMDGIGAFALAGIFVLFMFVDGFSDFMYRGGILMCSVLTAILIGVLVYPRSRIAWLFSLKPFVWTGQRSYGIYLWHYPIILLLKPLNGTGAYSWWFMLLCFVVTFVAAALSYTFVENPIRRGGIGKMIEQIREQGGLRNFLRRPQVLVTTIICAAVLVVTIGGCSFIPEAYQVPEEAIVSTGQSAGSGIDLSGGEKVTYGPENGVIGNVMVAANKVKSDLDEQERKDAEAARRERVRDPILIGDSVPGDTDDDFNQYYKQGLLDGYIGRWFWQARDVYKDYLEQDVVGDCVVFACFTNFGLRDGELDEMLELVGPDKQIFLVNVYSPVDTAESNNAELAAFADAHDNVHLVDWHAAATGHEKEYLWDDEEHLRPEGAAAYQRLIYESVKDYMSPEALIEQ